MTCGKTIWRKWLRVFLFIISAFPVRGVVRAQGKEIRVAAAADFKFAMGDLSERFEKQTGIKVHVTYGSSGNFFSQMQNGAPFDLFFSADIANPDHAPYGRAAVAALQKAGIYEQVKTKLVYGENISQAAQFVQSGNAQAGIVAMSLAVSPL